MAGSATGGEHYLAGQENFAKHNLDGNSAAIANFKRCLESDPAYAPAYVALSVTYTQRGIDLRQGYSWLNDAIAACDMALALDNQLVDGYRALWRAAYPRAQVTRLCEAAQNVVERDPDDAEYLRYYGWLLWFTGRADEALPYLRRAVGLKSSSRPEFAGGTLVTRKAGHGDHWAYFFMGNASLALELYEQAEQAYGRGVELKSDFSSGHMGLICTYLAQGKRNAAKQQQARFREHHDDDRFFIKMADVDLLLGEHDEARALAIEGTEKEPDQRYWPRGILPSTILGFLLWGEDHREAIRRLRESESIDRTRMDQGDESLHASL